MSRGRVLNLMAGMAESGFFPLVIYYLTTFYRRGELARRLAIFYAASNIANAFSGLLAFGVFRECLRRCLEVDDLLTEYDRHQGLENPSVEVLVHHRGRRYRALYVDHAMYDASH